MGTITNAVLHTAMHRCTHTHTHTNRHTHTDTHTRTRTHANAHAHIVKKDKCSAWKSTQTRSNKHQRLSSLRLPFFLKNHCSWAAVLVCLFSVIGRRRAVCVYGADHNYDAQSPANHQLACKLLTLSQEQILVNVLLVFVLMVFRDTRLHERDVPVSSTRTAW